jgi:hypothetical protein
VTAGVAVSVAACMVARGPRLRTFSLGVAVLLTTSTVVQLTRARWIGLLVGILLVSAWLMINGGSRVSGTVRRRLGIGLAGLVFAGLVVVLAVPGIASGGTIIHRVLSVFTDLQKGGGTVAVRESVTKTLKGYLGEKWPAGLGFVPPSAHYYQGLPHGSIRDSDVGVLNAIVTMGIVGAVLVYLPVVSMLAYSLRRTSRGSSGPYGWLRYGGAIWIISTLVSSITLVTLFSPSGLVLSGLFLTLLAHPSVLEARRAVSKAPEAAPGVRQASQIDYRPLTT